MKESLAVSIYLLIFAKDSYEYNRRRNSDIDVMSEFSFFLHHSMRMKGDKEDYTLLIYI